MNLTEEQKTLLKEYFKNDEMVDAISRDSDENVKDFLIHELRHSKSKLIMFHNEQSANSINFFVREGEWSNLSQILRSLPHELKKAKKETYIEEVMNTFADQVSEFMGLSRQKREMALNYVREK